MRFYVFKVRPNGFLSPLLQSLASKSSLFGLLLRLFILDLAYFQGDIAHILSNKCPSINAASIKSRNGLKREIKMYHILGKG